MSAAPIDEFAKRQTIPVRRGPWGGDALAVGDTVEYVLVQIDEMRAALLPHVYNCMPMCTNTV